MALEPEGRQLELLAAVLNATAGTKTKVCAPASIADGIIANVNIIHITISDITTADATAAGVTAAGVTTASYGLAVIYC
jgi:hypothetical protein